MFTKNYQKSRVQPVASTVKFKIMLSYEIFLYKILSNKVYNAEGCYDLQLNFLTRKYWNRKLNSLNYELSKIKKLLKLEFLIIYFF